MIIQLIYALVSRIAPIFIRLRLWVRGRQEPAYLERLSERFGKVPAKISAGPIVFHMISAGEVIAGYRTIIELREVTAKDVPFLITTTTPTGSAEVQSRLLHITGIEHCYLPYDVPKAVRLFLDRVKPRALVVMETELWPNLFSGCYSRNIKIYLINARLSERSAKLYARFPSLTAAMLRCLTKIVCQYEDTEERFKSLGADPKALICNGSVKFDAKVPSDFQAHSAQWKANWPVGMRSWIVGSSHPGEEDIILAAHEKLRQRYPALLLILVPRHPYRSKEVVGLTRARGFKSALLSDNDLQHDTAVLIGDTMGALIYLYGFAEIAFLGGSLNDTGGHNPIESAIYGIPMIMGPSRDNFEAVIKKFEDKGCLFLGRDSTEIAEVAGRLLADKEERERSGKIALQVVENNRGAQSRLVGLLRKEFASLLQQDVGEI